VLQVVTCFADSAMIEIVFHIRTDSFEPRVEIENQFYSADMAKYQKCVYLKLKEIYELSPLCTNVCRVRYCVCVHKLNSFQSCKALSLALLALLFPASNMIRILETSQVSVSEKLIFIISIEL
jgi:hypothetical protein